MTSGRVRRARVPRGLGRWTAVAACAALWITLAGCANARQDRDAEREAEEPAAQEQEAAEYAAERRELVRSLAEPGPGLPAVEDPRVLRALRRVPRHRFVPDDLRGMAYADRPLPIGQGQTISQPYIVARMTELLRLEPGDRVLEVGTGSGYQAAVLAEITDSVYTVEIRPELARTARKRLQDLGYGAVEVRIGNGYHGWEAHAPYDAIVVTAAPEAVPEPLIRQLAPGGRMIIPVGPTGGTQRLLLVAKGPEGEVTRRPLDPVRFVPLVGEDAPAGDTVDGAEPPIGVVGDGSAPARIGSRKAPGRKNPGRAGTLADGGSSRPDRVAGRGLTRRFFRLCCESASERADHSGAETKPPRKGGRSGPERVDRPV